MPFVRKTWPGAPFESVDQAIAWLDAGQWVRYRHKPYHPEFWLNASLSRLRHAVDSRQLFRALDKDGAGYRSEHVIPF